MNLKTIAPRLVTIAATGALLVGGTMAYFFDEGQSTGNVFSAGILDLKLSNNGVDFDNSVTATFGGTNMAPGGPAEEGTLTMKNVGTLAANHVDLEFSNVLTFSGAVHPMDQYLEVMTLTYGGVDLLSSVVNLNSTSFKDLDDLENQNQSLTDDLVNLDGIAADATKALVMSVRLHSSATNDIQGQSVTMSIMVSLNQGPHSAE